MRSRSFDDFALFEGVSPEALSRISAQIALETVPQGRPVFVKGDEGTEVFFLVEGELVGIQVSEDGKEIAFAAITVGSFFGEMAVLDGGKRSLTIQAAEDSVIGSVEGHVFLEWLEAEPQISRNLLRNLAQRTRVMNERVFELIVHKVEDRVRLLIARLAVETDQLVDGGVLVDAPSHDAMAAHIGSNREAVSRALAALRRAQIIRTGRLKITILDAKRLTVGL